MRLSAQVSAVDGRIVTLDFAGDNSLGTHISGSAAIELAAE